MIGRVEERGVERGVEGKLNMGPIEGGGGKKRTENGAKMNAEWQCVKWAC